MKRNTDKKSKFDLFINIGLAITFISAVLAIFFVIRLLVYPEIIAEFINSILNNINI